jgi:hypothetical protein
MKTGLLALLVAALLVAGCGSSSSSSSSTASAGQGTSGTATGVTPGDSSQPIGFEGAPIQVGPDLAPASTTQTEPVDGIKCGPTEQLAYHIHSHLAVYVDGKLRALPGGIGIPGSAVQNTSEGPVAAGGQCIYWLHTHAPDGVIHVESPTRRVYTLGNFFDLWHQPLSGDQVAQAKGKVTAIVNKKPYKGNPRNIQLLPHAVIQLSVGSPAVPVQSFSWTGLQL